MNFSVGSKYKTRGDLLVVILKMTPQCKYKFVGYFEIWNIRIRVFYDGEGYEFFGERQLDLMRKLPDGVDPLIKETK